MTVPLSKRQQSEFTPACLANLSPAPIFRFRAPTALDKDKYRRELHRHGLRFWSQAEFQAETITAISRLWEGDDEFLAATIANLKSYWELQAQAEKDDTITVPQEDEESVRALIVRLMNGWPMLNEMNADNLYFNAVAPRIALGLFLVGWKGLDLPFRLEAGQVSIETVDALSDKLEEIEQEAVDAKVEGISPGVAFVELASHALSLMTPAKDAEKNSPSPSSPSDTPNGSTAQTDPSPLETTPSEAEKKPADS